MGLNRGGDAEASENHMTSASFFCPNAIEWFAVCTWTKTLLSWFVYTFASSLGLINHHFSSADEFPAEVCWICTWEEKL